MRGLLLLTSVVFLACGKHDHDHGEDHSHLDTPATGHAHSASYGGRLVEVGDHEFQVELLLYPEEGRLEAYTFDGCAEKPVACAMKSITVEGEADGKKFTVELQPAASLYAKQADGKATKFSGTHESLKGLKGFKGTLANLTLADKSFDAVAFEYAEKPEGHEACEHDHEHGHGHDDDHEHGHE